MLKLMGGGASGLDLNCMEAQPGRRQFQAVEAIQPQASVQRRQSVPAVSLREQIRGRSGFTLVEILCAVALLSIGLLAVMSATRGARDAQQRALYLSLGRNVAQSKIETLRASSFDSLAGQAGTTTDGSLPAGNQVVVAVDPYPDGSETNLKRVTVTVTWPEAKGTRRIRYDTLIARR